MARIYNVFVSHSWDYVSDLQNLRSLLSSRGYFKTEFTEVPPHEPINSENAYYIKKVIKERIRNSHILLALAGIYASHSEWMEWEIQTAKSFDIPIVGVIPRGQTNASRIVTSNSIYNVNWNTESIVNAIRTYSI